MISPLVSCIIPVYDGERYLEEALDSVFKQGHRPIEVIVVNDGSTDRSLEIAERYRQPVVCLSQPNAGHAAARNRGLSVAHGGFVAFLDADDLWHSEKIGLQLERFHSRPELGVVFTHLQNFISPDAGIPEGVCGEVFQPTPGYTSVSILVRREIFERVGIFDATLRHGSDRDWFCRAAEKGVIMEMLKQVLVQRRLHSSNRSRELAEKSRSEYLRILKGSLDRRRRDDGGPMIAYPFHSHPSDAE